MWHFRIWFSKHGGVGWMVGLHDVTAVLSQLQFSKEKNLNNIKETKLGSP